MVTKQPIIKTLCSRSVGEMSRKRYDGAEETITTGKELKRASKKKKPYHCSLSGRKDTRVKLRPAAETEP